MKAGGRTIAIMGTGIDSIYPSENRQMAEEISHQGALITEFPLGSRPERSNFPTRNRIISGLSLGILVVEAPESSGALQTVDWASKQGREVFAVPGNATSPNSRGTNRLIQDGAKLVLEAQDILEELNLTQQRVEVKRVVQQASPANQDEAHILAALGQQTLHVDEICRASNLPIHVVNATLVLMELKGMVFQSAPMTYEITG